MKSPAKHLLGLTLTAALCCGTLAAAAPATPGARPDHFEGSLVNIVAGARSSQPFSLSVDHYATPADLQRLADALATKGAFSARDQLWKETSGYLSVGGRLGYPIAAVTSEETPGGRQIRVIVNRPLSAFEAQYYTRSSKYPFTVVELTLDNNGHGEGRLIGAAKMRLQGNEIAFESLGTQPVRLLDVRQD